MTQRMRVRGFLGWAALAGASLVARSGHAEINVRDFVHALRRAQARGVDAGGVALPRALTGSRDDSASVVVELPQGALEPSLPFVRITDRFATLDAPEAEILRLSEAHPEWRMSLGAPLHTLIDKADTWIHASEFRAKTGNAGAGVVIGIIDTGIDPGHGDMRNADGTSRIRWTIDFSREAEGLHADLEAEYGCDDAGKCAIFANTDLDRLLANGTDGDEPRDTFGHGTHVASLAAGNGLSQDRAYYIGVAPEAQLISARVTRAGDGSILDSDILRATRFIFDRAAELGMPAVVNLSLGSDFGAHDGSSTLEQALAAMVGPEHPGRAIVVAAGNSGALYTTGQGKFPEPLGIHTEVHVPRESPTRVPLVTLSEGATSGDTTVFVWIGFQQGDDVSVAFDDQDGEWIPLIAPGEATTFSRGEYKATIFNGSEAETSPVPNGTNSAVLVLEGSWPSSREFSIRLEGHGTADLWVQSEAGVDPESSATAVFPRGEKQGTINIPGTHAELIAVGATLNRKLWIDHRNLPNEIKVHGGLDDPPNDTPAYFSSAGPSAQGLMKPDIIAPGVYVIGAMSKLADPRSNGHEGVFAAQGRCGDSLSVECYVVDNAHAVSSGTSMAAPLVTGAIALLFERDPTLTQDGVRALLQAGAHWPTGIVLDAQQVGPGELDLEGALAVQISAQSPIDRVPGTGSWLAVSSAFAHPDPNWPVIGLVELRDDSAQIADGFDSRRLTLEASRAVTLEPLTRVAPGLWRFQVAGPAGSGGETLQIKVRFDDVVLLERELPIGVDRWAAEERPSARGGCGVSSTRAADVGPLAGLFTLLVASRFRARGRSRRERDRPRAT